MPAGIGIPIGNLTSQIFANIYLNEFDQFVRHRLKPLRYIRYGDDCLLFGKTRDKLRAMRQAAIRFLHERLGLAINRKNDIIVPVRRGIHFLGVHIFPGGTRLNQRNWQRAKTRLHIGNAASYAGLVAEHGTHRQQREFPWLISNIL